MCHIAPVFLDRFGGQFSPVYGDTADNHFDTMWLACCTFYQLMTGEDWDGVMKKAINAKGALYFLGNFRPCAAQLLMVYLQYPIRVNDARSSA